MRKPEAVSESTKFEGVAVEASKQTNLRSRCGYDCGDFGSERRRSSPTQTNPVRTAFAALSRECV